MRRICVIHLNMDTPGSFSHADREIDIQIVEGALCERSTGTTSPLAAVDKVIVAEAARIGRTAIVVHGGHHRELPDDLAGVVVDRNRHRKRRVGVPERVASNLVRKTRFDIVLARKRPLIEFEEIGYPVGRQCGY